MLIETNLREVPLRDVPAVAREAEALGYDGLAYAEVRQDPFLACTLMAAATERATIATSVAIAFPRSPMVVAYASRNIQDLADGRFALGLGTQVRSHILRRFSSPWVAPGPQLREYVQVLRAIWDCWQNGAAAAFQGQHYTFTLMTPEFDLGPTPHHMPIHLAAVNPYNIRTAALYCDALRVHSFCTPEYLRDVIWPQLRAAAADGGRSLSNFDMIGGGFVASGPDEASVAEAREKTRKRVAFYGSTPSYRAVFEHHGWHELGPALRRLIAQDRWDDMAGLISDEVLDTFCIAATYDHLARAVEARMGGLADRIMIPLPSDPSQRGDRLAQALAELKRIPTAREQQLSSQALTR